MKYIILFLSLIMPCMVFSQTEEQKNQIVLSMPEIQGTIRAKYEYQPEDKAGRFQVRNARFSLSGNVCGPVSYKAEIDLSDEGSIKMLDAFTRLSPFDNFDFTIGQMRVPFTIDAHRSPHQQYFANRSFIAKQVGNVRDVGATIGYNVFKGVTLQGGVFNGSGLTNQKVWTKEMNYSAKAILSPFSSFDIVMSIQKIKPEDIRINMYDLGISWHSYGFHIEAEYLYKKYSEESFDDVMAFNSFINYDIPMKKVFSKISVLCRFDYMDNHSNGIKNQETKLLEINDYERKRITGGLTFSLCGKFTADIRLNYENYFYPQGSKAKTGEKDKFVIEFMTRF